MTLDQKLCQLPLVGRIVERMYSYFKKHTAYTDFIHIALGAGIAFILAGWMIFGISLSAIGILGHLWAFIRGKDEKLFV